MSKYSFESLVSETGGAEATVAEVAGTQLDQVSAVDATSLAEAVDIQSEVQDLVVEMGEHEITIEAVQDAADAADTAEQAGDKLAEAAEAGEEPSVATVEAINLLLARAMKGTGRQETMQMSAESFAPGRNRKAALSASAEGIVETAKDLYKAAVEFIKKLIARVAEWYQRNFGSAARLEAAAGKLLKRVVSESSKKLKSDIELSARRYVGLLGTDGNKKDDSEFAVAEVAANIKAGVAKWGKLNAEAGKIAEALKKGAKAQVSYADHVFGYKATIETDVKTGEGKEAESTEVKVVQLDAISKDLVKSDAVISKNLATVGDFKSHVTELVAFCKELKVQATKAGELKKDLDNSIKAIEASYKTAADKNASAVDQRNSKAATRTKMREASALVKVGASMPSTVGLSGAAQALAFYTACISKTEKAGE